MAAPNSPNGNVNLKLNILTIDDVLKRAALNTGIEQAIIDSQYNDLRQQLGKLVFYDKVVVYRPDINSSLTKKGNTFTIDEEGLSKIEVSIPTIQELSGYGAKIVIIAHQGTAGQEDCISLVPHHKALEDLLGNDVPFVQGDWYGEPVRDKVNSMQPGQVILLDNVRGFPVNVEGNGRTVRSSESFLNAPSSYTKLLEELADIVVNDGVPVWHRFQASVMGMPNLLNIAGRQAQIEIEGNRALGANIKDPCTMLLGGVKITDYLDLIETSLQKGIVDKVLASGALGIMGNLAIMGQYQSDYFGKSTEGFLKKEGIYGQLARIREIARRYPSQFIMPLDFKVELDEKVFYIDKEDLFNHEGKGRMHLYGIGPKTVELFKNILKQSNTIYTKGPPTKNDDARFAAESKELIDEIVRQHQRGATTVLSGGHTNTLIRQFGYTTQDFSFVTLAGGAATQYHNGTPLPGLLMLDASYRAFYGLSPYSGIEHLPIRTEFQAPTRIPALLQLRG